MAKSPVRECQICHKTKSVHQLLPAEMVRPSLVELIRQRHPNWSNDGYICLDDLNHFRSLHVEDVLEAEKGQLSDLERDVVESLRDQDLVTEDVEAQFEEQITFGQRLADYVAAFGGSWTFIIFFAVALVVWIVINTAVLIVRPFDPYPYILLNLVLSCLAAIQAPVIMMSQNRLEAKDRLRAQHDYRVNLKAELEVRLLHQKLDLLLTNQWQRLLEIQQMQIDLMQEMAKAK
jgi:uncharacterized membrane protein